MTEKLPLHQKIGKEIRLKPTYAVLQIGDDAYSGVPQFVTAKAIFYPKENRREIQYHVRLFAEEGKNHTKLAVPVLIDVDFYVEQLDHQEKFEQMVVRQRSLDAFKETTRQ